MLKRLATFVAILPMAAALCFVPSAASATGNSGSPAGNNGTVKVAEDGDLDTPGNTPHVGCTFIVEWYGFDKGSSIVSTVQFEMQAPTSDVKLTVDGPSKVWVGADDNSGGGSAAGLDGRQAYELSFQGAPQAQQGYHVKLTVETPGSQGADKKSKVIWVTGCEAPVTPAPKLAMTKTVTDSSDADTLASQGETLTYAFSVTNTGNVALSTVKITDAKIPALASGALCVSTLAVGATTTCPSLPAATHVVTAGEVADGKVPNTATSTGTAPSGATVTATGSATINTYAPPVGPTPAPAISLSKSVTDSADEDHLASQGETLTYAFTVTNTGNVTLTNITITDAMIPALSGGALCVTSLPAGATTTCPSLPAATHSTTAGEVAHGSVDNTATVVGTPPTGGNVGAHGSATIATYAPPAPPAPAPSVSLSKSVTDSGDADQLGSQGETLTYAFSVTNTGNVALSKVVITDEMIPALAGGALCVDSLAVGATTTCPSLPVATHVVTAEDVTHGSVDNTATVVATPPTGSEVSAEDSATIDTLAGEEEPPGTPDEPFTWDWTYEDPTCNALTVEYPWNIPDGQANDVNVRIETDHGQVTLNFHNNEGFWSGNTEFDYSSHPNWPADVTSYTVVWTQVGGTNYHWQGKVPCVVNVDGDPATDDQALAVTSITGFNAGTEVVEKGDVVETDTVGVAQTGDEDLVLQKRVGSTWVDVKSVATRGSWARVSYGRQTHRGTFKYRLAVPGSTEITGAATQVLTLKVK